MTADVVVLTGPPGAGKSTIAPLLADEYRYSVHLHSDDFWHVIRSGAIPPYEPESQRQNEIVIDVLAGAAFGYAAGGYTVFCDGIVGPWFLDPFRAKAAATGIALHYVVLRPDEPTVLARAQARGAGALTDADPLHRMYAQFADLGSLEPHVVDSTGADPQRTSATVHTALRAGTHVLR